MRIINLVENETGSSGCEAAHGLSFYVETEKHKLLFDAGPTEAVFRNAQKLGINLTSVDTIILSHGHYDHSGGILAFAQLNPAARIYMQHNAGGEYYAFDGEGKGGGQSPAAKTRGFRYIGIDKKILSLPQVQLLRGDTKLDNELQLFTVDVERRAYPLPSTNARLRELCGGQYGQDDFSHEQNLLLTTAGKKILFCGCAHNGILNVLDALERKLGTGALPDLVLGGFHLMNRAGTLAAVRAELDKAEPYRTAEEPGTKAEVAAPSQAATATPAPAGELADEIREIAERLKSYKAHFATCHCTGLPAFNQMKEIMGDQLSYVYSGDEVEV
ncbi:MAG: MBL fold metallo-hydrolase [Spirochaetaceae bacterium]|nr:MBL fold metallo-hydrolase [Spirochaetaceae bacterium]